MTMIGEENTSNLHYDDYHNYGDNHSRGYYTIEPCDTYTFVITGVLTCTLCVAGIVGNFLSLVVLSRLGKASVTFFLLKILAGLDGIYLAMYLVTTSIPSMHHYINHFPEPEGLLPLVSFYLFPVASMALTATIWVTSMVTIHRYLCVCFPLTTHRLSTMPHAYWQVALVITVSILIDIPRYFENKIFKEKLPDNRTIIIINHTALWHDKVYQIAYKTVLMVIIRKLVPVILVTFLTYKLVSTITDRETVRRTSLRKKADTSESITKVLVTVTIVFVVCQFPMAIYPIFRVIMKSPVHFCDNFYSYFATFADFLSIVNSAVNFCIYYPAIPSFRYKLAELVRCPGVCMSRGSVLSDTPAEERILPDLNDVIHSRVANEKEPTETVT